MGGALPPTAVCSGPIAEQMCSGGAWRPVCDAAASARAWPLAVVASIPRVTPLYETWRGHGAQGGLEGDEAHWGPARSCIPEGEAYLTRAGEEFAERAEG